AALKADCCDIYTDVDGVYSTDPRVVPEARRVERISYDEMLELASLGAGVMHSRSIEFAKKFGVTVHVRSSFSDNPGTIIGPNPESPHVPVCGVALAKEEARFTVIGVPDRPGVAMELFSRIAEAKIPTDMIAQNISSAGKTDISFTVPGDDFAAAREIITKTIQEIGAEGLESEEKVSKVSVVGLGMENQTGVAQKMFHALSKKGINISMITTSDIKISALVARADGVTALRAVHEAFELNLSPEERTPVQPISADQSQAASENEERSLVPGEFVSRLTGMEEILIEEIALDQQEMRFTLSDVPDRPGLAAAMFDRIAEKKISVDLIVQSVGRGNLANISFTVARSDAAVVAELMNELSREYKAQSLNNPTVAKLTIRGTGLRSHTGLVCRMFKTLSENGINVSIICTSERNINVIVDESNGENGFQSLNAEFAEEIL
ncbi:MAG: aspartate kinase, partial [Planctomycetia bacterium]|nr:aspartate kinase [Planctomycetia bacterium]